MVQSSNRRFVIHAALGVLAFGGVLRAQTTQPEPGADSQPATRPSLFEQEALTGDWVGLRPALQDIGIDIRLYYHQHYQQNFRGGLDTHNGHRLTGSSELYIDLDFEKMGLLEDTTFTINADQSWSEGINPGKVGALFDPNGDAGGDNAITVDKWWFKRTFFDEKLDVRLGRVQSNKDLFDVSLYANHEDKDFLNRSSIRNSTIPHITGLGAFIKAAPVEWLYGQAAVIDAQSRSGRTGFDSAFHDENWWRVFWETGLTPTWQTARGGLPGRYRFGAWYDPVPRQVYRQTYDGRLPDAFRGGNLGFYMGFDQKIWKENDAADDPQGLGFFARYGVAHRDVAQVANYWQMGASYRGVFPERDEDVMGFSFSQNILSRPYREYVDERADRESVWEWYYQIQVTPWCTISPDLQVIQNPGGNKDDRDALVGGVRVRVTF